MFGIEQPPLMAAYPYDLAVSAADATTITLSFLPILSARSYEYSISSTSALAGFGAWTALATNKIITGLSSGTQYWVKVRVGNGLGRGPASRVVTGTTTSAYTGPGDIVSFTAWWGMRAYSAATAGTAAIRIRKDTGGAETDINTTAAGVLDAAAIVAHLAGDTGHIVTWYDKVGSNHLTMATTGKQPVLTANALGSSYGGTWAAGNQTQFQSTSNMGSVSQPYTMVCIGKQPSAAGEGMMGVDNGSYAGTLTEWTAAGVRSYAGSNFDVVTAANTWHALIHLFNGASSVISVDGSESTGNPGAQATSNNPFTLGRELTGTNFSGLFIEAGWIAGTISGGNRTALNANMHAAYGTW